VVKEPQLAPQIAPQAAPEVAQTVSKANGKMHTNEEPFGASSFAHLPADVAAKAILKQAVEGGKYVRHPEGYQASTHARIQGERKAMAAIGAEAPGLPIKDLTARLEGTPDQATAKEFREHYKKEFPEAAAVFDKYLSDETIARFWKRKGKK